MVKYNESQFQGTDNTILEQCRTRKLSIDEEEYICTTCKNHLKKNAIPDISVSNGLQLDEITHELNDLNSLESVFISRRIPFMKLLALPRGKQRAIHGCVVNIPVNPEESVSVLPRPPSADAFITVKLKRKLQYRGHVRIHTVRPQKIEDALHCLKYDLKNSLYDDVIINENWKEKSEEGNPDMWNSLTGTQSECHEQEREDSSESMSQKEDQKEDEEEDPRTKLGGIAFDSCVQPKDISAESNLFMSYAPGENKRPKAFREDDNSEELSFPQLFPSGKFGLSMKRAKKLSMKKYFQTRILNCDNRFAKNTDYLFYAQYRCEAKDLYDSLSVALRKGKNKDYTAGDLKQNLSEFIRTDLGVHFIQKVRGSPAYFNKLFYDLLGMIRNLGPCTWFVTLSAADLKWTDTLIIRPRKKKC